MGFGTNPLRALIAIVQRPEIYDEFGTGPYRRMTQTTRATIESTYRIVYQVDENSRLVHVLDIDHRSEIYRRSQW